MTIRYAASERALLNSDSAEYMNALQLAFFRERLLSMRDELDHHAAETIADLQNTVVPSDSADRATQEEEQESELNARERDLRMAEAIEHALRRIENRTYGFCEATGEPIGLERLLAQPTATLTLTAQQDHERSRRQFGR